MTSIYEKTKPNSIYDTNEPSMFAAAKPSIKEQLFEFPKALAAGAERHIMGFGPKLLRWGAKRATIGELATKHIHMPGAKYAAEYLVRKYGLDKPVEFFDKQMSFYAHEAGKMKDFWDEQASKGWEAPSEEIMQAKWRDVPIGKAMQVGGQAIPSYGMAIGATVATKSPSVGLMSLSLGSGAEMFSKQIEAGTPVPLADALAHAQAAWEYTTELIPFQRIFKPNIAILNRIATQPTIEAVQELIQGVGENMLEHFGYNAKDWESIPAATKEAVSHATDNFRENFVGGLFPGLLGAGAGTMFDVAGVNIEGRMTPEEQQRQNKLRNDIAKIESDKNLSPQEKQQWKDARLQQEKLRPLQGEPVTPESLQEERREKYVEQEQRAEMWQKPDPGLEILKERIGKPDITPPVFQDPSEPPAAEGEVKQPWEMTAEEWAADSDIEVNQDLRQRHKERVKRALEHPVYHDRVPQEILKEYPDLANILPTKPHRKAGLPKAPVAKWEVKTAKEIAEQAPKMTEDEFVKATKRWYAEPEARRVHKGLVKKAKQAPPSAPAKTEREMFAPAPEATSMFAQPTPAQRATEKFTKILTYVYEDVKPKQMDVIAAERTERFKRSIEGKEGERGEAAGFAAMKPLEGAMAEKMFDLPQTMEPMSQADKDAMFDQIATNNPDHSMYLRKIKALWKVLGGQIPQPKEIELLGQEFGADFAAAIPRTKDDSRYEKFLSFMGMPKAIVASFDLSAPLRQGIMLLPGHPVQWSKAFGTMMKTAVPFKGEAWAESIEQQQQVGKFAELRKSSKLYQAPLFSKDALGEREEAFMTRLAQKVPGIKWSERTYVTFLNQLRINVFNSVAQRWEGTGKTKRDYEVLAKFINHTTGRGDLGKLSGLTPELNAIFFSPRFMASRVQVWGDPFSGGISKETRALIASDLLSFVGSGMMLLSLAALGGAEVEPDPRSSDFGKIKIGNTRWDIWAGHQQIARYTAQMITGQRKATTTGRIDDQNRLETLKKYFAFKTSPMAGFTFDVLRKKTLFGEDISLDTESAKLQAYNRLAPMFVRDVYEGIKVQGLDATTPAMVPAAFLGVGVQTYEPKRRGPKRPSLKRERKIPSRYP